MTNNNDQVLSQEEFNNKIQSENYRVNKYLKAITALSIFNIIFLIMWIIGVVQWVVVYNKNIDSSLFILFVVSFVLFMLTWIASSVIAIFSVIRHFKQNFDIYPHWVYILSKVMIVIPDFISIILYIWISINASYIVKYN